ncbi:hypothetical protein Mame01_27750 [Microbispora amethystogenes]|nr:hypothetical protein Mame01_27750 [Microbispora amethystogenes]
MPSIDTSSISVSAVSSSVASAGTVVSSMAAPSSGRGTWFFGISGFSGISRVFGIFVRREPDRGVLAESPALSRCEGRDYRRDGLDSSGHDSSPLDLSELE